METIKNVTVELRIPYNAATHLREYAADDTTPEDQPAGHHYRAIAISPGTWNDTVFLEDTLAEMVKHHNDTASVGRIRICAEHDDSITGLIGRSTDLTIDTVEGAGKSVIVGFDLFDKTQLQQDVITQLQQAPDLLGLSIGAYGNLIPRVNAEDDTQVDWVWDSLRLAHIAILTWPACDTTSGSIVAAYKHADGTEFNPAIFMQRLTDCAMADPTISQTPTQAEAVAPTTTTGSVMYGANSPTGDPQPTVKDATKYAAALDLAQVISLSKTLGIEANPVLLGSLTTEQAKNYATELAKIAEARQIPAPAPEEKGSEYGAAPDDTLALAKQLLNYGGNAK